LKLDFAFEVLSLKLGECLIGKEEPGESQERLLAEIWQSQMRV